MINEIITLLDHVALIVTLLVFGKAGVDDWRRREVQDKVWLACLIVVLPYWFLRLIVIILDPMVPSKEFFIALMLINVGMAVITALGLGLLGMWGGGDVKGFMILGFGVVVLPLLLLDPTSAMYQVNQLIPPTFTILTNAYLILMPLPAILFIKNMYLYATRPYLFTFPPETSRFRKVLFLFLARPYHVEELERLHYWHYDLMELPTSVVEWIKRRSSDFYEDNPEVKSQLKKELEELLGDRPLRWTTYLRVGLIESDFDVLIKQKILETAKDEKKPVLWAQRSIPFVLFMFLGLVVASLIGNVAIYLLSDIP